MALNVLTGNALGHDGEGNPRADLVGVVGAGDQVEESGEWVSGGERNLAHLGAGGAEVAQGDVHAQVAQLAKLHQKSKSTQLRRYHLCK